MGRSGKPARRHISRQKGETNVLPTIRPIDSSCSSESRPRKTDQHYGDLCRRWMATAVGARTRSANTLGLVTVILTAIVACTSSDTPINTPSSPRQSAQITSYKMPTPKSMPFDITAGPDGELWLTEGGANKIAKVTTYVAKVTPSGVITEYPLPEDAQPWGITAGPDGNVWFSNASTIKPGVAKVTPAGVITEYSSPDVFSAQNITTGPDGNLWFTESCFGSFYGCPVQVIKVTTSGIFTTYTIPKTELPSGYPTNITSGPDGNLWLTMSLGDNVTRLTTSGAFTGFTLPGFPPPGFDVGLGIASGPDGDVWFIEAGRGSDATSFDQLVRLVPPR